MATVKSQEGYKEGYNNNTKYGAWYGLNYQPWCAMGLSWCIARYGSDASAKLGKFASCSAWARWGMNQGIWHAGYSGIRAGDIVFYTFSHVELVRGVTTSTILTYGFNTSSGEIGSQRNGDGVYARTRKKNSQIWGYIRPRYAAPKPKPPVPAGKRSVTTFQTMLEFSTRQRDGEWGPITDARAMLVRNAARNAKGSLSGFSKANIRLVQAIVDTTADGVWGKNSRAKMKIFVKVLQKFLNTVMGTKLAIDGDWGAKTDKVFLAFRKKYHR